MDIAHLRDFIAVVDAGSLTRAAASLHVSQPALSQRMTQLEHELDTRLLDRGPRGVDPTAAGATLYRDAQQLVRQFNRLATSVADDGNRVRGPVAVGLPTTVAHRLAPALYSWTKKHHPGVHLQIFESMSGYIQELLQRGRMDLAVLFRDDTASRPAETPLYSEQLYLIGSGTDASDVPLRSIEDLPLVAPGERSNLRALIERVFRSCGLEPHIVADVESLGAMVSIARSGEAYTILPRSSVGAEPGDTVTAARRIIAPTMERHVAVCSVAELSQPRDAVQVVHGGIIEVTHALAEEGAWPGIRPAARR